MIQVVGINGSARANGNTAIIIKIFFEELEKEGIITKNGVVSKETTPYGKD